MDNKKKSDLYSQYLKIKKKNPKFYLDYKKLSSVHHFEKMRQKKINTKQKYGKIEHKIV